MKNLMSILFLICLITQSQSQVVNFPDVNFKNALLNHNPVIDLNQNGSVEISEAHLVNVINVDDKNIQNLSGLSNFINLEVFSCQNNSISTLNLSNLTQLISVYSGYNNLNIITLNNLPNLKVLYCENNLLSSIDLDPIPNLEWLVCNNNQLSEINITNATNLTNLYCYSNNLTYLDLNNLSNLKYLLCQNNYLSSLDLSNCNNLYWFWGHNNTLTDLNIKNNQLFSDNNNFSVSGNLNLQNICCDNGELSFIINYLSDNSMSGVIVNDECSLNNINDQDLIFTLYPNPVTNYLCIDFVNYNGPMNIYDNTGKLLMSKNYDAETSIKIDLEFLKAGLYLIKAVDETGSEVIRKIIKQ